MLQKYEHKFKKEKNKTLPMGICPYCEAELHLSDFLLKDNREFVGLEVKKGFIMCFCPRCKKIISLSKF